MKKEKIISFCGLVLKDNNINNNVEKNIYNAIDIAAFLLDFQMFLYNTHFANNSI